MQSLPVIDISQENSLANAELLAGTCQSIGFILLKGHGVSPALQDKVRSVSSAFFDLPTSQKMAVEVGRGKNRGYRGFDTGSLAFSSGKSAPPDLRESFLMGPPDVPAGVAAEGCFAPNIWPESLPEMRDIMADYHRTMADVAARTLDLAALALRLPERYFRPFVDRSVSQLQIVNYPDQSSPPAESQLRASAHTDFGSLTLLLAEDKPGGLQVRMADGRWLDVAPPDPSFYIVNIGDLMARWTNDRWRSTVHRVVNPPREAGISARRLSVVFFHHPNEDAIVACLPTCASEDRPALYPPTTAGQHMIAKISAVYARKPLAEDMKA